MKSQADTVNLQCGTITEEIAIFGFVAEEVTFSANDCISVFRNRLGVLETEIRNIGGRVLAGRDFNARDFEWDTP